MIIYQVYYNFLNEFAFNYRATRVPVGEDQLQHLQLAQDLARMFNKRFGQTFPIPRSMVSEKGNARLRSLRDPTKKMSKSDTDKKSCISLLDSPDTIALHLKKAVTDFTSKVILTLPFCSDLIH